VKSVVDSSVASDWHAVEMLAIGEFARLAGTSVRTVRYYHSIGLLEASAIDELTGYRLFRAQELGRLHRIVALKELGLSLSQIRELVDGLSADVLRGMLVMKRLELESQVKLASDRLNLVEQRLRYIEQERDVPIEAIVKQLPPMRLAAVSCADALGFDGLEHPLKAAFQALAGTLRTARVKPLGPPLVYIKRDGPVLHPFACFDIGDQHGIADSQLLHLEGVEAASAVCRGNATSDDLSPMFGELAKWAAVHGYEQRGPGRIVILEAKGAPDDVLELQLPVVRHVA
jgi:DNA-binding transcriptional MerR regulator